MFYFYGFYSAIPNGYFVAAFKNKTAKCDSEESNLFQYRIKETNIT